MALVPHGSHFRSHHLSLFLPFTPDLKHICFTNPFLHSLSGDFWNAFMDLGLAQWALAFVCFCFFFTFLVFVFVC